MIKRGTTVKFKTTFYDPDDAVVNPASAQVSIDCPAAVGTTGRQKVLLEMAKVNGSDVWAASWDTRGLGTGIVFWAINSTSQQVGITPVVVEQGTDVLVANPANRETF